MEPAWIQGHSGCNVTVAVVDDGSYNIFVSEINLLMLHIHRAGRNSWRLVGQLCK